jgi:hypothetical protein
MKWMMPSWPPRYFACPPSQFFPLQLHQPFLCAAACLGGQKEGEAGAEEEAGRGRNKASTQREGGRAQQAKKQKAHRQIKCSGGEEHEYINWIDLLSRNQKNILKKLSYD